jgi:hypothetical protein
MDAVDRGGAYLRCANPSWSDPLDGSYSMRFGGRWNAPGTFPVVYLSADRDTARANARHLLTKGFDAVFVSAEDLDPSELPTLVTTGVPDDHYIDVVTDNGCVNAGLPTSYPYDATGQIISHSVCQPIGLSSWINEDSGIACRSAAPGAPPAGEELAYFDRPGKKLEPIGDPIPFEEWYGPIDW